MGGKAEPDLRRNTPIWLLRVKQCAIPTGLAFDSTFSVDPLDADRVFSSPS